MLARLPRGPELSMQAASVVRDSIAGAVVAVPPRPSLRSWRPIPPRRPLRRRSATWRGRRSAGRRVPDIATGRDAYSRRPVADSSPLTAASASTTPWPTTGSQPGGRPVRRVLDALHDLPRGQLRRPRAHQRGDSAHHRCRVTRSRDRHWSPDVGRQRVHQPFAVGIQRHDALARCRDVHPRPGQAEL